MSARFKITTSTLVLLVACAWYWNFHDNATAYPQHPAPTPVAQANSTKPIDTTVPAPLPRTPVSLNTNTSEARHADALPRAIRDRMADARVLAERIEPTIDNRFNRIRIVEHDSYAYALRVVDTFTLRNGQPFLIKQHVMAAGHVIVGAGTPESLAEISTYIKTYGDYRTEPTSTPQLLKIILPAPTLEAVSDALSLFSYLSDEGSHVEPDILRFPTATPNDPDLAQQYALGLIDAATAWDTTTGSRDVVIAIIDTGMDLDHPDLVANLWQNPGEVPANGIDDDGNGYIDDVNGWDFFGDDNLPNDTHGHGTRTSGVAGATGNNGIGITGINWQTSLLPLRVGDSGFFLSETIEALDYVRDLRVNRNIPVCVTNNSYGAPGYSQLEYEAIQRQQDAGILFIAAAGNDGNNTDTTPIYPGAYDLDIIVNVANTTSTDTLSGTSNYGATSVDLAAPGVDILTTTLGGGYATSSGTSLAAPQVTGAAALAFAKRDDLDWQDVRHALLNTVDPLPALSGNVQSGGRLNLASLIAEVAPAQLIAITSPQGATHLSSKATALIFETAVTQGGQATTPADTIAWSASPSTGVTITPLDATRARIVFTDDGTYTIAASLTVNNRASTDMRTVFVGPSLTGNVAAWECDGTGTTVADTSGNGHDATLEAGAGRTTGFEGTAYDGDGVNDRASVPSLPSLPVISIAAWVYLDSVGASEPVLPYVFSSQDYFLTFDFRNLNDGTHSSLKFGAVRDGVSNLDIWNTPEGSITLGQWYHVAVVHDDTTDSAAPRIFLNGSEVSVSQSVFSNAAAVRSAGPAYIGNSASSNRGLDGKIDNLFLFDRSLTQDEIAFLANTLTPNTAPDIANIADLNAIIDQAWSPAPAITDSDGPDALAYAWEVLSGPDTVATSNTQTATPTFTFPVVGNYTLQLNVTDGDAMASRQWNIAATNTVYQVSMTSDDAQLLLLAGTTHPVTLSITPTPQVDLAINYSASGTAITGTDYQSLSGLLSVPAGEGSDAIPVALLTRESGASTSLTITLANSVAYTLGADTSATLTLMPYTYANWATHYQLQSGQPPDRWTLDEDSNANGLSNLLEFSLGIDPVYGNPNVLAQRLPEVTRNASGQLVMTYQRPIGSDAARYAVGASSYPSGQPFTALPDQGTATVNADGTETVTATDASPLNTAETRFLFLQVSEPVTD